jgi:hypothetical protein
MAPPLVVEVRGQDLVVGGLAEFLEGGLDIVLVVDGPAPPAPLARLIAPGVFVVQTTDPAEIAPAMAFEGPAIAALMPEGTARFVHDPAAGAGYRARLTVKDRPEQADLTAVGRVTVFQQIQDLEHLDALAVGGQTVAATAAQAGATAPDTVPTEVATPADRLAGWLIQQARLPAD